MNRERIVVTAVSLLLLAATVRIYLLRHPPYFAAPRTLVEHVRTHEHEVHRTLLVLREAAPLIPKSAQVTVFRPLNGRVRDDSPNFLTAVGMLPDHDVLPSFTAAHETPREQLVEWVIAIGEPFTNPAYKPVAGFADGWLYRVER
jgi:hypothetical protein